MFCRSSYENCRVCTNNSHSAASALIPFPPFDFQPSTFDIFRKLSFQHSRTYLQEPALRRSGGIQSCPTVTGVSSPIPLSSPPPLCALAQSAVTSASSTQSTTSASKDRWLHVRVISSDAKGETVRVNVPLELAEKVLPTINKERI